jgi:hypothetical protein
MSYVAGAGYGGGAAHGAAAPKSRFAYTVIVSEPRYAHGKASNADAVAAALVNMIYAQMGPRQNAVQGLDARDPNQKAYALRMLAERGLAGPAGNRLPETPLLFSARENVFTRPGVVSLQLVLDIASQIKPHGPGKDVMAVMLCYPMRHELVFSTAWANALEAAETPEAKMRMSPEMADRMRSRQFTLGERGPVSQSDITAETSAMAAAQASAGSPTTQSGGPRQAVDAPTFASGMDTYADLSVASHGASGARRVTITHVVGSGGTDGAPVLRQTMADDAGTAESAGGVLIDIESRMFERLPQIRNVSEERAISERDLVGRTDEASTKREIQRVRMERAKTRIGTAADH